MRRVALLTVIVLSAGCAPRVSIPDADRQKIETRLEGQRRWLRVAVYASPFFNDRGKVFLSDAPASELDLLRSPSGEIISPPAPEKILSPGTAVLIEKVEFPTGWTIARRILFTPRYHPWVYLRVLGDERPYILVLPQTVATFDDVRVEIERLLAPDDPTALFQALPQPQREAIAKKEPLEGMGVRGLEMAWGYPEKKVIDRPAGKEEWIWSDGKRRAFFEEGRLTRWEPR